jgi:protocatechuate 3,4-dioxygenase beta subunit
MSDANGLFAFESKLEFALAPRPAYAQNSYILLALHPDYAFDWYNIRAGQEQASYELVLTEPATRTITVTDHNGLALGGARVWLYHAGDSKGPDPLFQDYLKLPTDIGLIGGLCDANGHALITNMPRTKCSFHTTLEDYARGLAFSRHNQIRLSKGADIYGRVLGENKQPVVGAIVSFSAVRRFLAKTDSGGYFAFEDLPAKGWDMSVWGNSQGSYGVHTVSIQHEKYAAQEMKVTLLPDQVIDDFIIEAHSGTLIRCHVLDADTNEPVPGAHISGWSEGAGRITGYSDATGLFTARVAPGQTSLSFSSPPDGTYVVLDQKTPGTQLTFDANGPEMTVTLKAPTIAGRLIAVFGTVLDPCGLPLGDATVYACPAGRIAAGTRGNYIAVGVDDEGQFELTGVPAGHKLCLYAETNNRRLAGTSVFEVPKDHNETPYIELKLQATQKASTVIEYEPNDPAANVSLDVKPVVDGEVIWRVSHDENTDENGMLEITGILPGLEYSVRDERFQETGWGPEPGEKWFEGTVMLIPLESDLTAERGDGKD